MMDPNYKIGTDIYKKYLIEGGLPDIKLNEENISKSRKRYLELYKKTQKLNITKEEEKEFEKLNSTKETDPEYYSSITGIILSEIQIKKAMKQSFKEKFFKSGVDLNITEADIQLIEKEVYNLEKKGTSSLEETHTVKDIRNPKDFYIPPIPDPRLPANIFHKRANLPLEYYDNDDGFWDEYIDSKKSLTMLDENVKNIFKPLKMVADKDLLVHKNTPEALNQRFNYLEYIKKKFKNDLNIADKD